MPAVPSCILDPLREQFLSLLPVRHVVHPLGCHRRRIDDAVVFDKLVEALVFGAGYERLADAGCSATTMRRRRDEWIRLGVWDRLRLACLDGYEKMIGLDLADLAVDGCTTKAPCGGECAGRSPVDRAKGGLKRSQLTDGAGIPIAAVSAPANTVDHTLLSATLGRTAPRADPGVPCATAWGACGPRRRDPPPGDRRTGSPAHRRQPSSGDCWNRPTAART
jgi:hypothetical protein